MVGLEVLVAVELGWIVLSGIRLTGKLGVITSATGAAVILPSGAVSASGAPCDDCACPRSKYVARNSVASRNRKART